MRKCFFLLIIAILIIHYQPGFAQADKPKVVLVLSGGGAKGFAHIPVLQALDSLGIVPDLIIGTSIGSIVGGLYAIGYSGDSIMAISSALNWDEMLKGGISLEDVSVEEKSEFKQYLIELDIVKGKLQLGAALLSDQKVREQLTELIYPVLTVKDFDDLPIPYRAMATDIVNGKEVILEGGSLGMAMRASMSLPGVFKPVHYNNTLLVDGGMLNNFPVDIAVSMGADIIIGSDVGDGMEEMEALDNSITSLLFQASMLTSNLKNENNRSLCTVLIDHTPNLSFSTGDFNKAGVMYHEGQIATMKNLSSLSAIAEKLKDFEQRKPKPREVENMFFIDTIIYHGISEDNLKLVEARSQIKSNSNYSTRDFMAGIDRVMGTTLFNQITYDESAIEGNKLALHLRGLERSQSRFKGSLHYDTYRSVGMILNYTGRNIIGSSSRLLVTLDAAEQPKFRVQYQKNFSKQKKWWWRMETLGQQLKQPIFINGVGTDDMRYRNIQAYSQVNRNINSLNSFVGIDFGYAYTHIKPKVDPELDDNKLDLNLYTLHNLEIAAHYKFDNFNHVFYATKGTRFDAGIARSLLHDIRVEYFADSTANRSGATNGFTKLSLAYEQRIPFHKKVSGIIGVNAAYLFLDKLQSNDVSFSDYGYDSKYLVGGNLVNVKKNGYRFSGLHEDELPVNQFTKIELGIQYSPFKSIYVIPHFDMALVGFGGFTNYVKNLSFSNMDWQSHTVNSMLLSTGATLAYHSFLGPVSFDVSWVNGIKTVRLFFSIGIPLNRS